VLIYIIYVLATNKSTCEKKNLFWFVKERRLLKKCHFFSFFLVCIIIVCDLACVVLVFVLIEVT